MIRYNWNRVKNICNYDPVNILQYFCLQQNIWMPSYLPKRWKRHLWKTPLPFGDSFLLNINPVLLNEEGASIENIYEYIELASLRPYFDYKIRNITSLSILVIDNELIDNTLLSVKDGKVFFKYETEV